MQIELLLVLFLDNLISEMIQKLEKDIKREKA